MAAMLQSQPLGSSSSLSSEGNLGRSTVKMEPKKDPFPAGLRVLVVDDDPTCLLILEKMLRLCLYEVTTCVEATGALAMLRQNKNRFDLVISDVYMPDMDGFKLLELVGLEMDLPVIMMSIDGETSAVMKGITHGACDYLLKPVRMEALRNIWQHVVRKRRNEARDIERSGSAEDNERIKRPVEDKEHTCSSTSNKRKDVKEEEDDDDHETDDPMALKKPRVLWSVELHQQFVSAVNQLGIDKAVPKRILELMGVQGLTRENVASHLQKYRLYLKRLSVAPHQNTMKLPFAGGQEVIHPMSSLDGMNNMHSVGSCGQLSPQAFASVRSGVLRRLGSIDGLGSGPVDSTIWQQVAALRGSNYGSLGRPRQQTPWLNSQGNSFQALPGGVELDHLHQTPPFPARQSGPPMDALAGPNPLQHQIASIGLGGMGTSVNIGSRGFNSPSGTALIMQLLQQQQQQQQHTQNQIVAGANLPTHAFLGQNILSNETNHHVAQLPSTGSTNPCFHDQVRSSSPNSRSVNPDGCLGGRVPSASHELNSHVSTPSVDDHFLHVAGADFQAVNGRDANPCLSGAVKESGVNVVKVNEKHDSQFAAAARLQQQPLHRSMAGFGVLGNNCRTGPGFSQEKNTGWHGQNAIAVQDLIPAPHHLESPVYGHITNANENKTFVFGQVQGDFLELTGTDLEFSRNAGSGESSRFRPSARRVCTKSEHSITESNHKQKEQWVSDYESYKQESAPSNLKDTFSDDLLTLVLKQQQQMMGFTGTELPLDGYAPEICM